MRSFTVLAMAAALLLASPAAAGPAEEAKAAADQWVVAFNIGDLDKIVAIYTSDASVHGTVSPNLAVGSDALRTYFAPAFRNRNQVRMSGESVATVLSDAHVVVAGFYEFSGTRPDGQAFSAQARYSFVVLKRDGAWRIVHHHSSPRPRPAQ